MIRVFDIPYQDTTSVTFTTEEITTDDSVCYVVYDTSTGVTSLQDYYTWRASSYTSSGYEDGCGFVISNSNFFPKFTAPISDYTILDPYLFFVMTSLEHYILMSLLDRIDLVRRRLPNPGAVIEDVDGMGDSGVVSVAGGYDKKFAVSELMRFIEGALIEINIHPPATNFYWNFTTSDSEKVTNPYIRQSTTGIPYKFVDLIWNTCG